jgi:Phage integrase family
LQACQRAGRSSWWKPSRSALHSRPPHWYATGRTAGAQGAGRGPGERRRVRKAHTEQGWWESSVWLTEGQEEPPVYPPQPASRASAKATPGAPSTRHRDSRRPLLGSGPRLQHRHGRADQPSNLRQRSFASLLKQAGPPHMRFHDLPHTCATLLLSRSVHPKFVQKLLGHAAVAITLDTYPHVMLSMEMPPQKLWKTRPPKDSRFQLSSAVVKKPRVRRGFAPASYYALRFTCNLCVSGSGPVWTRTRDLFHYERSTTLCRRFPAFAKLLQTRMFSS